MVSYWPELESLVHIEKMDGAELKRYKNRPLNLNQTLEASVSKFPDKIALVHEERRLTYREFGEQVDRAAAHLQNEYGIKKGDRIALLLMNGLPFAIAVYAALKIGAIAVPLNTKLKSLELEYMISNSASKILITDAEWWPHILPIKEGLPVVHYFVSTDRKIEGTFPFPSLVEPADPPVPAEVSESDIAFIMYTSGTTGKPKGAAISHGNMVHTALNYEYCYGLSSDDSTVIAVPIFHITGLAAQLITFVHLGGKTVMMPKFEPQHFLDILQNEKITHMIASPTVYVMALQHPDRLKYNVDHVRVGGFGGAPMPSETLKSLKEWIPHIELHNTYGLTETSSPAVIMPFQHQLEQLSAVGLPTPVTEVKLVSPETEQEVAPGEIGELLFKGPMVIKEYWNNEEANRKSFKDGWFHTGDLATMDENGFITIMDRIKDMINRGGEKIYSVEVEDVLYSNTKISEAAIVGVPDEKYGEAVKACIVLKTRQSMTEEEVKDWVKERLAKYKVPEYVEFMDVLPRNPNGKVVKTQLRYVPELSQ